MDDRTTTRTSSRVMIAVLVTAAIVGVLTLVMSPPFDLRFLRTDAVTLDINAERVGQVGQVILPPTSGVIVASFSPPTDFEILAPTHLDGPDEEIVFDDCANGCELRFKATTVAAAVLDIRYSKKDSEYVDEIEIIWR